MMRRWPPLLALLVVLIGHGAAMDHAAGFHSDTVDESTYLAAATRMVRFGRDRVNREQPPLTKWLMAARLDAVESQVRSGQKDGWDDALWDHPPERMMRNLQAARRVNIGFALLTSLLLFAFLAARWGAWTGVAAALFLACSPLLTAHASLATMDAGATFTTLLVGLAFWRWWEAPSLPRSAVVATCWTLALLAKSTALLLPIPALLALLWRMQKGWDWRRPLGRLALCLALISPLLLWASYDFQVVRISEKANRHGNHDDLASLIGGRRNLQAITPKSGFPMPLYDYLSGVGFQAVHARGGHHSFLDGEVRYRGWASFYLHAIAYETPLIALLFGLFSLGLFWRRRLPAAAAAWLVLPAWWLFYFSLLTPAQGGLKYMLPALPFWAGFLAISLRNVHQRLPASRPIIIGALLLLAFSVHRHAPNYLMYFNSLAGGPSEGWRHLVHGKDWGQGQRQLAQWQRSNRITRLWYARYHGQPKAWGMSFLKPPCRPVRGWVAAHVIELQRPERHLPVGCLGWLKSVQPVGHFAHSILLWNISAAQFEALQP
jgi:4-amino-4-deoxy-L-arabinose transferase-like glycosyltransferase